MEIGKLQEVDLRSLWKHEEYGFTAWLSKPENIEILNELLGLTLTNVNREVFVGTYRCDLVATDEASGVKVIIENQLESTNHDHLGKIITYASGLDANVVVWIVKSAKEEHRSAIEWLINNIVKNISFFLIELHAYRIGESPAAPKFEIIEKPNEFSKPHSRAGTSGELTKSESEAVEFWTVFNQMVLQRGKPFNIRKATTDNWYDVAIGTSEAHISITLVNKKNLIGVDFYIQNNKALFDKLWGFREEIESNLGYKLDWQRMDTKKASRIISYIDGLNFNNHSNYNELMNDVISRVIDLQRVFKPYLISTPTN